MDAARRDRSYSELEGSDSPVAAATHDGGAGAGLTVAVPHAVVEAVVAAVTARVLAELSAGGDESWPAFMSVETAARYLDVSPERLRKLQARGEVPYLQEAPGCRVFFSREDLDEWMAGFRQPTVRRWAR